MCKTKHTTLAAASDSTYRYVQKLVAESSVKKAAQKIQLPNDTGLQSIDSDMVVYIEAIGKHTVVHFVDKSVTIKRIIGEVAPPLFPENFCRPHRGYLVNWEFISSVKRYNITMVTGMIISQFQKNDIPRCGSKLLKSCKAYNAK